VPAEKDAARELVAHVLAETPARGARLVRVNPPGTAWFEDDLAAAAELDLDAIVLPKATPDTVAELDGDRPPLLALVETAQGLRLAYETATSPRVAALALGAADLGAELGLEPRADGLEILFARSQVVRDSAAAGLRPPFDVVHLDVRDDEGLEAEALLARSLGFRGKLCIHPAQVPVVNRVFAPTRDELDWARSVLEAYEQGRRDGRGAVALDGSMIDLPVVERARRVLSEAEAKGGAR
jgi:citrate lyase beta subunit